MRSVIVILTALIEIGKIQKNVEKFHHYKLTIQ